MRLRLKSYTYRHIFYLLVQRWSFPLDMYSFFDLQSGVAALSKTLKQDSSQISLQDSFSLICL